MNEDALPERVRQLLEHIGDPDFDFETIRNSLPPEELNTFVDELIKRGRERSRAAARSGDG